MYSYWHLVSAYETTLISCTWRNVTTEKRLRVSRSKMSVLRSDSSRNHTGINLCTHKATFWVNSFQVVGRGSRTKYSVAFQKSKASGWLLHLATHAIIIVKAVASYILSKLKFLLLVYLWPMLVLQTALSPDLTSYFHCEEFSSNIIW